MQLSSNQGCSALVHKFNANICSQLKSFETKPTIHLHSYDKNEEKEEERNEMISSSDISTLYKEQIETKMGNKPLHNTIKISNFTELTDDQIKLLVTSTKFSPQQIREWHQNFLTDCPTGKLNKKQFIQIYRRFYTQGKADEFCSLAFNALDQDKNGIIDFSEFLIAIALTMSGHLEDRLHLAFSMYDVNGDGYLDRKDLTQIIKLIDELNGKKYLKEQLTTQEKVRMIINKLDSDADQKLSRHEFVNGCLQDSQIRKLLTP